jgi:hypothetical protein
VRRLESNSEHDEFHTSLYTDNLDISDAQLVTHTWEFHDYHQTNLSAANIAYYENKTYHTTLAECSIRRQRSSHNFQQSRFTLPNMSHSNDFAVDPSVPQDRKTRMKRRNAIVRRKRGRTDKSEDRRREDLSHSSDPGNVACENPSGTMAVTGSQNAAEQEQQRRIKSTSHLPEGLTPLQELAVFLSNVVIRVQAKEQFGSDVSTTRLPEPSENETNICAAPEA